MPSSRPTADVLGQLKDMRVTLRMRSEWERVSVLDRAIKEIERLRELEVIQPDAYEVTRVINEDADELCVSVDPDGFCISLNTGDRQTSAFMLCTGAQAETSVYTKNALARLMVAMEQDARSEAAAKPQEVIHG